MRAASLPNLLTGFRIGAAPLLLSVEEGGVAAWVSLLIIVVAALTDFADGLLARRFFGVSGFGSTIDPIADKIFVLTALLVLVSQKALTGPALWPVFAMLWRDLLIEGLRGALRQQSQHLTVVISAKAKTATAFAALICLFGARVLPSHEAIAISAGFYLLWLAAALSLYTGLAYVLEGCSVWQK